MAFKQIFDHFCASKENLKVIHVASCDQAGQPNSAPKMLVEIKQPNLIYYIDYKFTHTHKNLEHNKKLSISIMDEPKFIGYRVNGEGEVLLAGSEATEISNLWEKRLIKYEADRMVERIKGNYSTREAENLLPKNFDVIKFVASEGALVKPDRILRVQNETE